MTIWQWITKWRLTDDRGTTAIEFALIAPLVVMLLVGITSLSLMLFAIGSMHFAVEDAARCASARPTVCSSGATTVAYAQGRYSGVLATPAFTYATPACGYQVSASVTYTMSGCTGRQCPFQRPVASHEV
jgi:Flp pilus assembly protein TadG